MDNNKNLPNELLKADNIDPTTITDSERKVLKTMLDAEQTHI